MAGVIPTDFENLSTIAFLIFIIILAVKDRKNIEFKYGIFMRKMQRGKKWIYDVGDKHKKFFSIFGLAAITVGIIASLVSFYFILQSSYTILTSPGQSRPGLQPIIPSVPSTAVCTYALCVPFWYWIIGVMVVLLSHELSHAFVSRAENIRIKSFGLLSLLILPGAFVEPDEKQLKKSSSLTKLKIYAAGSFANIIIFAVATALSIAMFQTLYVENGVHFQSLIEGSPAMKAEMKGIITGINGQKVLNINDFREIIGSIPVGKPVNITTTEATYKFVTAANPENKTTSFIGIANPSNSFGVAPTFGMVAGSIEWMYQLLVWVAFLNIGIGLVNLLPIKPLDGGLVYEEILKIVSKKNASTMINIISIITFAIILINIVGPYVI